jgi:dihydroorotase-like cyclic amidohydrolase
MEFTITNARLLDGSVVDVSVNNGVISEIGNGLNKGEKVEAAKNLSNYLS